MKCSCCKCEKIDFEKNKKTCNECKSKKRLKYSLIKSAQSTKKTVQSDICTEELVKSMKKPVQSDIYTEELTKYENMNTQDLDDYLIDEMYDDVNNLSKNKILTSYLSQITDEEIDRKKHKANIIKACYLLIQD
jgi:phage terminase large subunit